MFTTNLAESKTRQNELQRQAENYRLVKSFEGTNSLASRFVTAVGRVMVISGQQLLTLSKAAH
jgi:hypothetical protein